MASYRLTFGASLIAALVNVVFGLLVAWVLVRYDFFGKKIVDALDKRDAPAALACMTDHMRPGRDSKTLNDFIISLPRELLAG
jgi:hypothetical protein